MNMISLLVGLGNIGEGYTDTRHNVGFKVVEKVRQALKLSFQPPTEAYDWAIQERGERQIILAWPKTYMNHSGLAARALLQEADLQPSQMLVVVDDFNLPLGRIRVRQGGSEGGHKGLASMIEVLKTEDFPRLRLGIGPVSDSIEAADFVLSRFEKEETELAEKMIDNAAETALFAIDHRLEEVMSRYNVNPA
jgi:PTH1 family peptidyl-tRNA hydrolase